MDPLTAALQLMHTVAEIIRLELESMPPEIRAARATQRYEDFQRFRRFLGTLLHIPDDQRSGGEGGPA